MCLQMTNTFEKDFVIQFTRPFVVPSLSTAQRRLGPTTPEFGIFCILQELFNNTKTVSSSKSLCSQWFFIWILTPVYIRQWGGFHYRSRRVSNTVSSQLLWVTNFRHGLWVGLSPDSKSLLEK